MELKELLPQLLSSLDEINPGFVIKDFVGFLNWEPTLGAALLAYSGHHSAFCTAVKSDSRAYDQCVLCSRIHERLCLRKTGPFLKPCYLGVAEYAVPIVADGRCIGSVSAGQYCEDPENAQQRICALGKRFHLEIKPLTESLAQSVAIGSPTEECKAIFRFVAQLLGEVYQPYAAKARQLHDKHTQEHAGFDQILAYIFRNYTNPSLTVATIARACNYSESYVSHTFKRRMKTNLRSYINTLRVLLAKHELRKGHSISFTAIVCGFTDPNYFSTVFRSMVGIPPSQYARHFRPGENPLPQSAEESLRL